MRKQLIQTFCYFALVLLLVGMASNISIAATPYYYSVKAKSGDSTNRLFQQFKLNGSDCNYDKFYELNGIDSKTKLKIGKKYLLPILIFEYNKKSIRTTLNLESWKEATEIKKYNEYIRKKGYRKQTIIKSNILWVRYNEIGCSEPSELNVVKAKPRKENIHKETKKEEVAEVIPKPTVKPEGKRMEVTSIGRVFPIFGKEYEYVPLINKTLQGKVFYIVSGHGGPDSGAIGEYNGHKLYEDEYAYDISLRLVRKLIQHGATAYMMTRDKNDGIRSAQYLENDTDEICWDAGDMPYKQKKRLEQRSNMVNTLYDKHKKQGITDQTLISIHIDSRSEKAKTDIFFYHFPKKQDSKKLATHIQTCIKNQYVKHRPGRPYHGSVTPRDLHMLRETKPKGVYIELGNIKNKNDQKRFIIESNRQLVADWLFDSLQCYK